MDFWEYFEQISKIPHCSGNEQHLRTFIDNEAKKLGFETKIDNVGNMVVKIPAKNQGEKCPSVILQSHLDMVCEKNKNINHDFSKDPLKLKVVEIDEEKWVNAEGTTLGADNAIGIAYQLTLMKRISGGDLDFGPLRLELLFTVNEEMGFTGANQIDKSLIDGEFLINLDSEEDNMFTIGCAGGVITQVDINVERTPITQIMDEGQPIIISMSGLIGGHSGIDIHKGRANSIKLLAKILWDLNYRHSIHVYSIKGGRMTNAIPRESEAIIFVEKTDFSKINSSFYEIVSDIKTSFSDTEREITASFETLNNDVGNTVFSKKSQDIILAFLYGMPNGPISMHPRIKDLVHTSSNLARIETKNSRFKIEMSHRSLDDIGRSDISERINALLKLCELAGLKVNVKKLAYYPSWEPNFNSKLLAIAKDTYKELFNEEVNVGAIHAGLECAILKKHFPNLDMISIGPKITGAHSPDERVKVQSVEKIWNFLIKLILHIADNYI
jgi:dipeptidase D